MVSYINSVFGGFGAKVCTMRSGVMLQNRGACFVVEPGHPNCIDGAKRSMHTIIPALARKDGQMWLSFGVMGGSYQSQGHAQVLVNMIDFGMDPQSALDAPRLFWDDAGTILVEKGIAREVFASLAQKRHPVVWAAGPHGCAGKSLLVIGKPGFIVQGSDPRKDGQAVGF